MIDEQSSASEHDYASDRSAIGAGSFRTEYIAQEASWPDRSAINNKLFDYRKSYGHYYIQFI